MFTHIDDAADSILNNVAEGSGSNYPGKRRMFYDIAAGSAREVRSGLRSLDERGAFNGASVRRPIGLTLVIGKMLKELILNLKP